jgi:hypothetical protein
VETSETRFNIYHIVGARQATEGFDIERTEEELGLKFAVRFEQYE